MTRITISDIIVPLAKLSFKSRFKMARACQNIPPLAWIAHKLFFEGDNMMVIPRDSTVLESKLNKKEINLNSQIPVPFDTVLPSQILKEIIKKSRNHVIMDSCLCRVSNDCKEYSHDLGCLFMGPGAKNIPLKLGKPVTEEMALKHVDKCQQQGLVHIIGRNKLDSIWLNTGPKEELLTVCSCCSCCCLWKMAPDLPDNMGRSIGPMVGVELKFNFENCTGCGKCTQNICFVNAIHLEDGKIKIDNKKCKICGRCVEICPHNTLKINMADDAVEKNRDCIQTLVNIEQ